MGACLAGHGCAGTGTYGPLGDNTTTQRLIPTAVSGSYSFAQISAGGLHTCGVLTNGAGLCWGECCERAKLLPVQAACCHIVHAASGLALPCAWSVERAHCGMS